ncbi:MAG: amidohydrolase family protein, partial [Chloroflexi bacterium]|nr:amidohydrolase family protein [Chloroflexota bacterium]
MRALLFHGGRVHVGDGTTGDALLARDGRVVAVGRGVDLGREAGDAERIDLRGGLMVPGWCDAHVHFMWWAIQRTQVDLRDAATVDEALGLIATYAAALPRTGWILGGRFDKNRWGRWPTAQELDRVSGGRPAALRSRDGHSRWLNSHALALAGIDARTLSPAGGEIDHAADGSPTGILKENANWLADAAVPAPTAEECVVALRRGQADAWARGLVGIEDLEAANAFDAFRVLHTSGALGLRVVMGTPIGELDAALAEGRRTGDGDEWLRAGHLKIFTDGALGSQT